MASGQADPVDIYCENLADFMNAVNEVPFIWDNPAETDNYVTAPWFRGQRDETWHLIPGLYRDGLYRRLDETRGVLRTMDEGRVLSDFRLRAPRYLQHLPQDYWG